MQYTHCYKIVTNLNTFVQQDIYTSDNVILATIIATNSSVVAGVITSEGTVAVIECNFAVPVSHEQNCSTHYYYYLILCNTYLTIEWKI